MTGHHPRHQRPQARPAREDSIPVKAKISGYVAAAPDWPDAELMAFYAALSRLEASSGLELPAAHLEVMTREPAAAAALPGHWTYDVTCLPAAMAGLRAQSSYGLASTAADGRAAALADAERARTAVHRLSDLLGRPAVRSVVLVSAPQRDPRAPGGPARAALAGSLTELAARDWGGAVLALEHCDAARAGQIPAKGFLSLEDELGALAEVPGTPVRSVINWGRSVIEQRTADAAVRQVTLARDRGLLLGVGMSGCSGVQNAWGEPWADVHLPPAGLQVAGGPGHQSLMTPERMTDFLRAAGPEAGVVVKVSVRPREQLGVPERVDFLAAVLDSVQRSWEAARPA